MITSTYRYTDRAVNTSLFYIFRNKLLYFGENNINIRVLGCPYILVNDYYYDGIVKCITKSFHNSYIVIIQ